MSEILTFKTKAQDEAQYKFLCKDCNRRKTCSLPYKNWEMEICDWSDAKLTEKLTETVTANFE